jgi:hypothetical protein
MARDELSFAPLPFIAGFLAAASLRLVLPHGWIVSDLEFVPGLARDELVATGTILALRRATGSPTV